MNAAEEVCRTAVALTLQARDAAAPEFEHPLRRLKEAAECVGQAWCGSWLPGLANFYDTSLQPLLDGRDALRARAHGDDTAPGPRCTEWSAQAIGSAIHRLAGSPDLGPIVQHAEELARAFANAKEHCGALLAAAAPSDRTDRVLVALTRQLDQILITGPVSLIEAWRPTVKHIGRATPAAHAAEPVLEVPAHVAELAAAHALRSPLAALNALAGLMRRAADYLQGAAPDAQPDTATSAGAWRTRVELAADDLRAPV